jgi:hypothetical protein
MTDDETTTFDALLGAVEPEILAAQKMWLRHRAGLEEALRAPQVSRLWIVATRTDEEPPAANVA